MVVHSSYDSGFSTTSKSNRIRLSRKCVKRDPKTGAAEKDPKTKGLKVHYEYVVVRMAKEQPLKSGADHYQF